ncbi:MAG: prepilin peptidase [Pirellulaceae bacterium]|nr:prepilin peptidase [Pirellulaceae bacterium]
MQNFVDLPLALRVLVVALLGIASARFINWAIYTWAYFPRQLGPWSPAQQFIEAQSRPRQARKKQTPGRKLHWRARSWLDHLPAIGWWRLRSESAVHGKLYWVRPMLVELLYPIALAWYYRFQVTGCALPPGAARFLLPLATQMHWQFVGHWVLLTLMTIATFIDFDEQSIPDYVTLPGTVIGLMGAALSPVWLPLTVQWGVAGVDGVVELDAAWPDSAPLWISGWQGWLTAMGIVAVWGFALLDRRVILRRGMYRAVVYFVARLIRNRVLLATVLLTTGGLMGLVTWCWLAHVARWPFLMSSLIGLAVAGGVTWAVRVSASRGFGAEALGFGDVTLMAMIGAYIGWQPSLIVFFLAPVVALVFVMARWMLTGDTATPYGPYLCAAVVVLAVGWQSIWIGWAAPIFAIGVGPIWAAIVVCVLLIGIILWVWQLIKRAVFATRKPK